MFSGGLVNDDNDGLKSTEVTTSKINKNSIIKGF